MTIVQELKELIKKRGGETAGIHTVSQAVKVLTALEESSSQDSGKT